MSVPAPHLCPYLFLFYPIPCYPPSPAIGLLCTPHFFNYWFLFFCPLLCQVSTARPPSLAVLLYLLGPSYLATCFAPTGCQVALSLRHSLNYFSWFVNMLLPFIQQVKMIFKGSFCQFHECGTKPVLCM